jgi:PAS domain S-box-containing protein
MKVGEGFNGSVAKTGRYLVVEDVTKDPLLSRQVVIDEGIRSQLIVPVKSKGKVVGTLCVAKRIVGSFSTEEVELLTSIGNQLGAGLENARLYQETDQALRRLKQSEERYRDLFENATDAIWVHDADGNTLAANKACEKVTGYSPEDLMNMHICQLMSDYSRLCVSKIEKGLLREEHVDNICEVQFNRSGKANSIVEVTTSLVTHEGEVVGFQHAARNVSEERQMQENLRYYLQQVTRAQEEERKRIARELHDETLQNLIVISRQLDKITSSDMLWEESLEHVRSFKKQIETAVQEIRRFSYDLRPSVLDDLGLLPALELLAGDLEKQEITTSFTVTGESRRLSPELEVMLFRIAQEAISNIRRHAKASKAELLLDFNSTLVRLSISDNGCGFNLPPRPSDLAGWGKLGLTGMHERANLLGGNLILKSKQGEGTTITAEVPISQDVMVTLDNTI